MTTNGLMNPEKLDITLMNEHLFMELWLDKMSSPATSPMDAKLWEGKLPFENLHLARKHTYILDNYILAGEDSSTVKYQTVVINDLRASIY